MIQKTQAIVLRPIKYGEANLIVHGYSEHYGRLSFFAQNVRSKNSRMKANLFQPLHILDIEMYYKNKPQLQRIKEARNAWPYRSLFDDYRKRSMGLFLAELLYRCIQEQEPNPDLYHFITNNLKIFDLKERGLANFHLYFMLQLTKYLGFYPQNNYDQYNPYFNGLKGQFTPFTPIHKHYLEKKESTAFSKLLQYSENQHESLSLDRDTRLKLLYGLLDFYYIHNEGMGHVNAFEILKETFR
mgnify:FL=1